MTTQPSLDAVQNVVGMLVTNALGGKNSAASVGALQQYKHDPAFNATLAAVFAAPAAAAFPGLALPHGHDWAAIRQAAGLTLKNNVTAQLGEATLVHAAQVTQAVLNAAAGTTDTPIVNTAAQVMAKITACMGMGWWGTNAGIDIATLLLTTLLGAPQPVKVGAALVCLQYLLEDAASALGATSQVVMEKVAAAVDQHPSGEVRYKALGVLVNVLDFGAELDWNVETFSATQNGLLAGAPAAARAATTMAEQSILTPHAMSSQVLRRCLRIMQMLVPYVPYMTELMDAAALAALLTKWAQAAIHTLSAFQADSDTAAEAADVIGKALADADAPAGYEGPLEAFAQYVEANLETLMPATLQAIAISDEAEADIKEKDDYSHRDNWRKAAAVGKRREGDDAEAAGDEQDVGQGLRNAACRMLGELAKRAPKKCFDLVWAYAVPQFNPGTPWRHLETAITALATVYEGCQQGVVATLPTLVPHLCTVAELGRPGGTQHICVTASALWAIGVFSEWAGPHNPAMMRQLFTSLLAALPSPSKHVQWACTTALRTAVSVELEFSDGSAIPTVELLGAVNLCVPVFHTNNLAVLCDVVCRVVPALSADVCAKLVEVLQGHAATRLERLYTTLSARFNHPQPDGTFEVASDAIVEKDVLDIVRAIFQVFHYSETAAHDAQIPAHLTVWAQVLEQALAWGAFRDDIDLIAGPLQLVCTLLQAASTETARQFHGASGGKLTTVALGTLASVDEADTLCRGWACNLLYTLLTRLGAAAVPGADVVVEKLVPMASVAKSSFLAAESSLVLSALWDAFAPAGQLTSAMQHLAHAFAGQVRSDTFGNPHMHILAMSVASMMRHATGAVTAACFGNGVVETVALTVKDCDNAKAKALATIGVCGVTMQLAAAHDPNATRYVQAVFRLLSTWRDEATAYADLGLPAKGAELMRAAAVQPALAGWLQTELTHFGPAHRQVFQQDFGI